MKNKSLIVLTALFLIMLLLLPMAVPSGAVTGEANIKYLDSMPMDEEYAFLYE